MSFEDAAETLQEVHIKAEALVNKWFPHLKEKPRDYRINVTATKNHLVKLMELQRPNW